MSNFIFLILDTYNEKEKKDSNIQANIKLSDFIKQNKKICFIFISIMISSTCFVLLQNNLYKAISFIIYILLFIILSPLCEKSFQKNFRKSLNLYNLRLNLLRNILKYDFELYEPCKIKELISQCDLIIDNFTLSKKLFKPLVSLTKSVIFPIFAFSLGLVVKTVSLNLKSIVTLTLVLILAIFMVLGIFYLVKPPIENYLDSLSNKAKELKGMLLDIYIKDFVKEKSKEMQIRFH